jgi:hypothetical protein
VPGGVRSRAESSRRANRRFSRTRFAALGPVAIALCLGVLEAQAPRAANADVDASGSWQLTFSGLPSTLDALFAQSGTNLSVVLGFIDGRNVYSGSIDPATGGFGVFATLPCTITTPPTPVPLIFSGTVSADGSTLLGTFSNQAWIDLAPRARAARRCGSAAPSGSA